MIGEWQWAALIALGIYHGVNPAMGWLFAVARGLQEQRRRAVYWSLLPIALGHEASVAVVVLLISGLQVVADPGPLRVAGALALIGFGLFKFLRPRSHPKWVGMRVSMPELGLWSFLMSTAHGAGLMLFPVVINLPHSHTEGTGVHTHGLADGGALLGSVAAVFLHTGAMLLAMAAVAVLVYEKIGVMILRKAWVNLDLIWAGAVVLAGVATLVT